MNKKLLFFYYFFTGSCLHPIGTVILLNGTGSAGKTSISKYLKNLLIDNVVFVSLDKDILWPFAMEDCLRRGFFSENMTFAERQKIVIDRKYEIFDEFIKTSWLLPAQMLHDKVKRLAQSHRYVVCDTVLATGDDRVLMDFWEKMNDISVFSVLVYCPPSNFVQHIIARNKLSDYAEQRDLVSKVPEFCDLYSPTTPDYSIDILTKQEVETALEIVRTNLLENGKPEHYIQEKITELRKLYYKTFFMNGEDVVRIAPHFPHNMIVNTGKLSPQQCAQLIYEKFNIMND